MTATKSIIGLVPIMQATALAGENFRLVKKKKIKTKDIVGLGMKNIVGVEFIKLQSQLTSGL